MVINITKSKEQRQLNVAAVHFAQTLGTASPFKLPSQRKTFSPAPFLQLI
jgi:hypothetical protein